MDYLSAKRSLTTGFGLQATVSEDGVMATAGPEAGEHQS
jgi:hypothetical protein